MKPIYYKHVNILTGEAAIVRFSLQVVAGRDC